MARQEADTQATRLSRRSFFKAAAIAGLVVVGCSDRVEGATTTDEGDGSSLEAAEVPKLYDSFSLSSLVENDTEIPDKVTFTPFEHLAQITSTANEVNTRVEPGTVTDKGENIEKGNPIANGSYIRLLPDEDSRDGVEKNGYTWRYISPDVTADDPEKNVFIADSLFTEIPVDTEDIFNTLPQEVQYALQDEVYAHEHIELPNTTTFTDILSLTQYFGEGLGGGGESTIEPQTALDWGISPEKTFTIDDEAATNPTRAIQLLVSSALLEHDLRISESAETKQDLFVIDPVKLSRGDRYEGLPIVVKETDDGSRIVVLGRTGDTFISFRKPPKGEENQQFQCMLLSEHDLYRMFGEEDSIQVAEKVTNLIPDDAIAEIDGVQLLDHEQYPELNKTITELFKNQRIYLAESSVDKYASLAGEDATYDLGEDGTYIATAPNADGTSTEYQWMVNGETGRGEWKAIEQTEAELDFGDPMDMQIMINGLSRVPGELYSISTNIGEGYINQDGFIGVILIVGSKPYELTLPIEGSEYSVRMKCFDAFAPDDNYTRGDEEVNYVKYPPIAVWSEIIDEEGNILPTGNLFHYSIGGELNSEGNKLPEGVSTTALESHQRKLNTYLGITAEVGSKEYLHEYSAMKDEVLQNIEPGNVIVGSVLAFQQQASFDEYRNGDNPMADPVSRYIFILDQLSAASQGEPSRIPFAPLALNVYTEPERNYGISNYMRLQLGDKPQKAISEGKVPILGITFDTTIFSLPESK